MIFDLYQCMLPLSGVLYELLVREKVSEAKTLFMWSNCKVRTEIRGN